MSPLIISILAAVAVAGFILALMSFFIGGEDTKVEDRLDVLAGKKTVEEARGVTKDEVFREGMTGLAGTAQKLFKNMPSLQQLFEQADSNLKPDTFLLLTSGLFGLGLLIGLVSGLPVPIWPLISLALSVFPFFYLMWCRKSRMAKFQKQMPKALGRMANALRSGNSLPAAIALSCEDAEEPLKTEFTIAYESQNLGIPIEQALKDVYTRVPNIDFKFFATAVAIQRQTGGDLAEVIEKITHLIKERFRIQGQVKALTGEGRISGVVLMALPIGLFFAVMYLNPTYVMLLFTDEMGRQMSAIAIVAQILGALSIRKIVNIKI